MLKNLIHPSIKEIKCKNENISGLNVEIVNSDKIDEVELAEPNLKEVDQMSGRKVSFFVRLEDKKKKDEEEFLRFLKLFKSMNANLSLSL